MHGMRGEQIELTIQINEIKPSGNYGVPMEGTHYTIYPLDRISHPDPEREPQ